MHARLEGGQQWRLLSPHPTVAVCPRRSGVRVCVSSLGAADMIDRYQVGILDTGTSTVVVFFQSLNLKQQQCTPAHPNCTTAHACQKMAPRCASTGLGQTQWQG